MKNWIKSGNPWIWLNAGAIAISMIMVFGLLLLITGRGMVYFWPKPIIEGEYLEPGKTAVTVVGEIHGTEDVDAITLKENRFQIPDDRKTFVRYLVKSNRQGSEGNFKNYLKYYFKSINYPVEMMVVERRSGGNFYGRVKAINHNGQLISAADKINPLLTSLMERAEDLYAEVYDIEKNAIGSINYQREKIALKKLKLDYYKVTDQKQYAALQSARTRLDNEYNALNTKLDKLRQQFNRDKLLMLSPAGDTVEIPLANIVRAYQPNQLSVWGKTWLYLSKFYEFLTDDPREANTEGGIFPAIFGTVVMVVLMSILVTPLGVITAIYLREYAKQGIVTRLVRISVNNLAGVPSIVYGVFGLGFFVYIIGGSLDLIFFPERESYKSTFGSPALIWVSLTLALLTLPVVIVATEEGLSRVPRSIREGSLALGATKAETLWRTVIPMASPGMITGLILAIARAAGEVAPLMLVGVVKYSPAPPIDFNAPFIHFDRTIMHLGFHIYDVGFQSPNSEAARPLVYATAFILVIVIIALNLAAITIRNRLREKYRSLEH